MHNKFCISSNFCKVDLEETWRYLKLFAKNGFPWEILELYTLETTGSLESEALQMEWIIIDRRSDGVSWQAYKKRL